MDTPLLLTEALDTFARLFEQAKPLEADATGMTLATVDRAGRPAARIVLLKSFDARGFVFYSHTDGRKGEEIAAQPRAALLFWWPHVGEAGVQVRIEGDCEAVCDEEADAYFASRPRMSQIGAWASEQSRTLDARECFEHRIENFEREFEGRPVPRPNDWSGIRVVPRAIEFWHGAKFRLHERWLYERGDDRGWSKRMLYP
ncbi:pyridoxamine 5'-phosphate oxidase [Lysobacter pythonis]|uniref:Pyridoxine/pyridoxamine 5'-phosphate oxidase n=1 Tax=Solilutibacter pythonis TaxID=2483112 RepID=A0A3M2HMQ5_9GAMM|nr:pyridoxamine 5'-phosphate oxidase [Lysobacter pythonis]RMH88629.1 pyridoxamine 5'-phosphate oxidase [Lysobacter pythonis]